MYEKQAIALRNLFEGICSLLTDNDGDVNVFKIFKSTPYVIYAYETHEEPKDGYVDKKTYSPLTRAEMNFDVFVTLISDSLKHNPKVKWCNGTKGSDHLRLRFADESWNLDTKRRIIRQLSDDVMSKVEIFSSDKKEGIPCKTAPATTNCVSPKADKKKGEKMGDFSLSNLKDAVIDKVTSLDRKTITILAIIALLLLIVGKYQTIKDILIGIKDKVKRSKNFKAMVEDGTNAINGLKKIVGIKDKGAKTDEA